MDEQGIQQGIGYKRPPIKTRFRKGQSGNPGGGSKRRNAMLEFRSWIEETCPNDPEKVFKVLSEGAKRGRDFRFVQEYLDRYQGKVPQKSKQRDEDEKPFQFVVKVISKETAEASAKLRKMFQAEQG